jgi:hypothetical protein
MATPTDAEARAGIASTYVLIAVCAVIALRLAVSAYAGVLHDCSAPVRIAGAVSVFGLMFVMANAVLFRPVAFLVMLLYLPFAYDRR